MTKPWIWIVAIVGFFVWLPYQQWTSDSVFYAACIRHGRNLFLPHHLLYNALGFVWIRFTGFEALGGMMLLNTLCVGGILSGCLKILQRHKVALEIQAPVLVCVAFSFALCRYAGDNEVYLIPIFCSVWASYFWGKYGGTSLGNLLISGGWMALACLFHQIHLAWMAGLVFAVWQLKNYKHLWALLAVCALVPLTYWLFVGTQTGQWGIGTLMQFVLHDFAAGEAKASGITWAHLVLTPVSLVRSFVQIHSECLGQLREQPWFFVPVTLALSGFCWVIGDAFRQIRASKQAQTPLSHFVKTHLAIAFLHVSLAFYAVGNAEFMVMIPVLLLLCAALTFCLRASTWWILAGALFLWNGSLGIYPRLQPNLALNETRNWLATHPNDLVCSDQRVASTAIYFYETGIETQERHQHLPEIWVWKGQPDSLIWHKIDSTQAAGGKVWRITQYPQSRSRGTFVIGKERIPAHQSKAPYLRTSCIEVAQYVLAKQ